MLEKQKFLLVHKIEYLFHTNLLKQWNCWTFSIFVLFRNLADFDKDGKLTCEEFCIAMHLADLVKVGVTLPPKLPVELYPNKGRAGSITGTTPRTGSFTGTPPPHQPGIKS